MFRILVADDEEPIRLGIQCLLDYDALGFTICGEAASGEHALEQIDRLQPDVVLMDIRMPGMSGLEVLRSAREQGFQGKVVIISGYSDFSYAQEAIRYGVQGYLTKPIDDEALEKLLLEFKIDMTKQASTDSAAQHYRQKAQSSLIRELLMGQLPPESMDLKSLGLEASRYQVILWDTLSPDLPSLPQRLSILGHPNTYDQIELPSGSALLLKGSAPIRQLEALLLRNESTGGELDGLFLACANPVDSLEKIPDSFRQAQLLQERRFFCPQGTHVLRSDALASIPDQVMPLDDAFTQQYSTRLLDCLYAFQRRALMETLQQLQNQLANSGNSAASVKLFLADLYLQIKEVMCRNYPENTSLFYTNATIIHTVHDAVFLHDIILFLAARFEMIMNATGTSSRDSVLDDVLHYIRHNYTSNITLESIALLFGYNRSYLGQIFAAKIGQSFNSYVDQLRVERAKELLLSGNTKVYSIAEQVGYKNVDYFHIKFRKIVGQSPAEFRRKHTARTGQPL